MKPVIIASRKDEASMNIFDHIDKILVEKCEEYEIYDADGIRLYLFSEDLVYLEDIDLDGDYYIFISKHASRNPIKCLTHHAIGNFSKAELGGRDNSLVLSSAKVQYLAHKLQERAFELGWDNFQEATHHGPYVEKPSIFLEIGSTIEEWKDEKAGRMVAENAIRLARKINDNIDFTPAIAIGTLHNATSLNKFYGKGFGFSHIMPKYMLDNINEGVVKDMIKNTVEDVNTVILDWKSIGRYKEKVVKSLEWFDGEIIKRK